MSDRNPILSKRGILLTAVFFLSFFATSFITDSLGIFVPHHDDYGDTVNVFDAVSTVPSFAICYLLEGVIAVFLKEESKEYSYRRYKNEALIFIGLYFVAIILFLLFREFNFSLRLSNILCSLPLLAYGLLILYRNWLLSPEKRARQQATRHPFITQVYNDAEQIGLDAEDIAPLLKRAEKAKVTDLQTGSFWLITNTIFPKLTSGHNHIYRGVLSMRGMYLNGCLKRLISLAIERKIITQEEADNIRANLRQEIAEVG